VSPESKDRLVEEVHKAMWEEEVASRAKLALQVYLHCFLFERKPV